MGEERANALLMVFIQAWRLQARPPHGRVGVNSPSPSLPHLSSQPLISFLTAATPEKWSLDCSQRSTLMMPQRQTNCTVTVKEWTDSCFLKQVETLRCIKCGIKEAAFAIKKKEEKKSVALIYTHNF